MAKPIVLPPRRAAVLWFLLWFLSFPALPGEEPLEKKGEKEKPAPPPIVEVVEVTANLARERRDPVTFTEIQRPAITAAHRGQDLGLLLAETPNAYAYSDAGNGVGYSSLRIRGFDQRRIAVNINGIPWNTPETHQVYYIDLADFASGLERIQVQRGTGTALYGSPAVGGVINLETGHLGLERAGEIRLSAGSFGTRRAALKFGGPLGAAGWAWQARVSRVVSDGYRDRSWTRHTLGFLALEKFSPDSTWRFNLYGGPEKTHLAYYGVPIEYLLGRISGDADRDRKVNFLVEGETDTYFQPHLEILQDWRLGEGLVLSQAAYATFGRGYYRQFNEERTYPAAYDATGYPVEIRTVANAWRKRWISEQQLGYIPRLSWRHSGGTLFAGLEVRLHRGRHRGWITEGIIEGRPVEDRLPLYAYTNLKRSFGAFVRESLDLTPALTLNLELHGTRHEFEMVEDRVRGLGFKAAYSFFNPRAGVNWNIGERWNLYASLSRTGREPAVPDIWEAQDPWIRPRTLFNGANASLTRFSDPKARPERLRAAELGAGYRSEELVFKVNLYDMNFQDELVYAGGIDDDGNFRTTNAGRSVHRGIEVEAAARLPWGLKLAAFGSKSRDELKGLRLAGSPGVFADYSGNRVGLFPDALLRMTLQRDFGPVSVQLGGRRVGRIYLDQSENERKTPAVRRTPGYVDKKIEPFSLFDLRAGWRLPRGFSLDLWVENLADKRYAAFGYSYAYGDFSGFSTEFFPGAVRGIYLGLARTF